MYRPPRKEDLLGGTPVPSPWYEILASPLLKYPPLPVLNEPAKTFNYMRDDDNAGEVRSPAGPLTPQNPPVPDANETNIFHGPINAAGVCSGGGCAMLRQLIYNDLIARGKTEAIAREWGAVAAEFEQVCGYKESYTRADVTAFLAHLRKRGLLQNTIDKDLKAIKLLAEIQHWGEGPQGKDFPKFSLRRVSPDEIRRTILSKETTGSMITLGKQGLLKEIELCYLALATTYGLRRTELARLQPASFLDEHHLIVDTAKGGPKTTQLIPPEIAPYLSCFKHYAPDSLTHMFHRITGKCGVDTGKGYGWHSLRRSLATELILSEASALNVLRFMRWSDASTRGEFGMLAIYAKKNQARIDEQIFAMHPFLPYWGSHEPMPRRIETVNKLQPLIDLIESGELDEKEIEQLLNLIKRKEA